MEYNECSKKQFASKKDAEIRSKEIKKENIKAGKKERKLRSYKCPICNFYHLTSMSKKNHKMATNPDFRKQKIATYKNNAKKRAKNQRIKLEVDYWEEKLSR